MIRASRLSRVHRVALMRLRIRLGYYLPADVVGGWETDVAGWPVLVYAQPALVARRAGYRLTCVEHGATTDAATKRAAARWADNVEAWCPGCQRWATEDAPVGVPVAAGGVPAWIVGDRPTFGVVRDVTHRERPYIVRTNRPPR